MTDPQGILVATHSFCFSNEDGTETQISKGTTVQVGHPIIRGREDMFVPLKVDYPVKRGPGRPRRDQS